ncbi:MAG: hypothetical protein AAB014_03225 [Nitrospirota bacterium]
MLDLKSIIFDNPFIKIISIVFAVILWFSVGPDNIHKMDLAVPIEVRNVPPALDIKSGGAGFINLRVSGRKILLKKLKGMPDKKIMAVVDLSNARAGENIIQISKGNINLPPGINLIQIYPKELIMVLEPRNNK